MVVGEALGIASFAAGVKGQSDAHKALRNQRKRVGKTLKQGRGKYALSADQALQNYLRSIGRIEEGGDRALRETSRFGTTGALDLEASLDRQLADNRQGIGGVLAQSSIGGAVNRGAHSDYRRDLTALGESVSRQRAVIHQNTAAQSAGAHQLLANALFKKGQFEFQMQEALARRFGDVAPPQGYDFSGLEPLLSGMFGGTSPGTTAHDQYLKGKHGV